MGGGRGGGYGRTSHSPLDKNLRRLESKFKRNQNGYFGESRSRSGVRRISSGNPQKVPPISFVFLNEVRIVVRS